MMDGPANKEDQTRPTFAVIKQCLSKMKQCAVKTWKGSTIDHIWASEGKTHKQQNNARQSY